MYFPSKLLSTLAILITCTFTAPPPPPHSSQHPSPPSSPTLTSNNDNPIRPTTATYIVPNTNVLVRVTALPNLPHPMPPAAIAHLISTGTIALDILAGQAGGPQADLDLPRIRWANSGLAIQVSDATLARPDTGGGPFRYDELSAAYRGVEIAVGILGGLECTFGIWRVSPIMRTRVKGLGWGDLRMAEMMDGVEEGMGVGVGG